MKLLAIAAILLPLSVVLAGPIVDKRQDGGGETTPGDTPPPGTEVSSTVIDESPAVTPEPETPSPVPSPVITPPRGSDTPSVSEPVVSPSPIIEPVSPDPSKEGCPPCGKDDSYGQQVAPNGDVCYCLGNGDTAPWAWAGNGCNDPAPVDDGRPEICRGTGGNPASRACLNTCNSFITMFNGPRPCSNNIYNAINACAQCGSPFLARPGGNWDSDSNTPYLLAQTAQRLQSSLADWCMKPSQCIDIKTDKRVSGQGGCPKLNEQEAAKQVSVPQVAITTTRSFIDAAGRPTVALDLLTIDDPAFTANSEFAGARPTTTAGSDTGSATTAHVGCVGAGLACILALVLVV